MWLFSPPFGHTLLGELKGQQSVNQARSFTSPAHWAYGSHPPQPRLFSLAHRQGAGVIVAVQVVIMAVLEAKRIRGWKKTGMSGVLSSFPFDPMGMTSPEKKVKEVKNARLAMVAFVGMCSQAAVTGMGPIECLKAHIADPTHVNSACPKLFTVCVVIHAHAR